MARDGHAPAAAGGPGAAGAPGARGAPRAPGATAEVAAFYDGLAGTYDRIFPDWAASSRRQGDLLHRLLGAELGPGPHTVLDCAAGIGTQLLGLAARGHRLAGSDLSLAALHRARALAAGSLPTSVPVPGEAVADMRALPFPDHAFDAVVCADNSLPHLLTEDDVLTALAEMRRVARHAGVVAVSTRDYDALREQRPRATPPQVSGEGDDTVVTLQVWRWHPDGERYDLDHLQLRPEPSSGTWQVTSRRATYWAIPRARLAALAERAGFVDVAWQPDDAFVQPLLVARVP